MVERIDWGEIDLKIVHDGGWWCTWSNLMCRGLVRIGGEATLGVNGCNLLCVWMVGHPSCCAVIDVAGCSLAKLARALFLD